MASTAKKALLDRPTADWLYDKIKFAHEASIFWMACVGCGWGAPLAPGERPRCHACSLDSPENYLPPELNAACWAAIKLGGVDAVERIYDTLWWDLRSRAWVAYG